MSQCKNFTRNAWKKDLCSNCYKSKEEHVKKVEVAKIYARLPDPPKEGILKGSSRKDNGKSCNVGFHIKEYEIIGYGGDDSYSDTDDDVDDNDDGGTCDTAGNAIEDSEEDKVFEKLTKTNTDYNSVAANLVEPKASVVNGKNIVEPLRLGQTVVDGTGKKKTLFVSVTPFGGSQRDVISKLDARDKGGDKPCVKGVLIKRVPLTTKVCAQAEQETCLTENRINFNDDNEKRREDGKVLLENKLNETLNYNADNNEKKIDTDNNLKAFIEPVKTDITLDIYDLRRIATQEYSDIKNEESVDSENNTDSSENLLKLPEPVTASDAKKKDFVTDSCEKIDNHDKMPDFENIVKGEEIVVFNAEKGVIDNDNDEGVSESEKDATPPALPLSPPPNMTNQLHIDPRTSFLHRLTTNSPGPRRLGEKPQLPVKPMIVQTKKINLHSPVIAQPRPKSPSMETFLDIYSSPIAKTSCHPSLSESLSDSSKKRQAPKPPSPNAESLRVCRSTENLLGMNVAVNEHATPTDVIHVGDSEIIHRKNLSLSQDSLLNSTPGESKKKPHRGRFFLRKLLHLGKQKELSKEAAITSASSSDSPKPKLEIIHPYHLDGAQVEVVPPQRPIKTRRSSSSASSSSGEQRESDVLSDSSASHSVSSSCNSDGNSGKPLQSSGTLEKSKKPIPPPRSHSLDVWPKPVRPPPPKHSMNFASPTLTPMPTGGGKLQRSDYVNLGEVRSALAPNKPVRTGSLREVVRDGAKRIVPLKDQQDFWTGSLRGPKKPFPAPPEDSGYESFEVSATSDSQASSLVPDDNVYECVQTIQDQQQQQRGSSPECDASLHSPSTSILKNNTKESSVLRPTRFNGNGILMSRRSEGSLDVGSPTHDYLKMRFLRSISAPYCGSETESEIYSPYSFCGSEMGEDDFDLSPTSGRIQKSSRLKMKKGRSVVHKSLEDNYGAVIVANHEALSQVVEQMHVGLAAPAVLRSLLGSVANLRWSDFAIIPEGAVVVEKCAFYSALWGLHPLTVCIAPENSLVSSLVCRTPFAMNPLIELNDLVPAELLAPSVSDYSTNKELVQATISVLPRIQVETLQTYTKNVANINHPLNEDTLKEVNFVILQMINAVKLLQAHGIEEAPRYFTNLIVVREERDPHHYPRCCLLPPMTSSRVSLCACVLDVLFSLPQAISELGENIHTQLAGILRAERANSLSLAKSVLEFALWGPSDISFGGSEGAQDGMNREDRDAALQRWLDLERATVLHGLVRTRTELNAFEEWHLLFLARTTAKILAQASLILQGHVPRSP